MPNTPVMTNGFLGWFAGPDSAITEANWDNGPTLTQLQALVNQSAGVKVDGTDFNLEASEQVDDRSFADQAGAQSRGALNASGSLEIYTPGDLGTTSTESKTWGVFATPRAKLALVQRPVKPQGAPIAAGDEVNVFRVITDGGMHNRNDASRTLGTSLILQDDILANYIVPAAVATAPAVSPAGPVSLVINRAQFLKVTYQGRNVTVGAKYTSSDESVAVVTPGGVIVAQKVGTASITVSYPGAAVLTPIVVTVTAT